MFQVMVIGGHVLDAWRPVPGLHAAPTLVYSYMHGVCMFQVVVGGGHVLDAR